MTRKRGWILGVTVALSAGVGPRLTLADHDSHTSQHAPGSRPTRVSSGSETFLPEDQLNARLDEIVQLVEQADCTPGHKAPILAAVNDFRGAAGQLGEKDVELIRKYASASVKVIHAEERADQSGRPLSHIERIDLYKPLRRTMREMKERDRDLGGQREVSVHHPFMDGNRIEAMGLKENWVHPRDWRPGQPPPYGPPDSAERYVQGRGALRDGNYRQAAEDFTEALKLNPNNVSALTGRSEARYKLDDYSGAVADARKALDLDPGNQAASTMIKLVGDRAGPSQLVKAGAGAEGGPVGGVSGSGSGFRTSEPGVAVKSLADMQRESAFSAALRDARTKEGLGDRKAALALLDKAILGDPGNPEGYYRKALMLIRAGQHRAALEVLAKGLKDHPNHVGMLNAKARSHNVLGEYRDAKDAATRALAVNPEDATAYFNLAGAEYGMGNRQAALEALRLAAQYDPKTYQALYDRAANATPEEDLAYLFGDGGPAAKAAGGRRWRFGRMAVLGGAAAAGGLLIALGLLSVVSAAWRERISTTIRRMSPAPAQRPTPAAVGGPADVIAGAYRVLRRIGSGGMGTVYEAMDIQLERPVAIKRMREEIRLDPKERERFLKEARTVAALRHPNIVEIFSIVDEGEEVYLVFEYVEGPTLDDLLAERAKLSFDEARSIFKGVCEALTFAHARGVIHRDLKPSNIMITKEGVPKVMDFGVARYAKDAATRLSMTNTVVGTPPYMAPEAEQGVVRKESDIFSLAACFYELITGQMPFNGVGAGMLLNKINMAYVPPSQMTGGLPKGVDDLMAAALQPDPDKRLKTPAEFLEALDALPV